MTRIRLARREDVEPLLEMVRAAARQMRSRGIDQWDEVYPDRATLRADVDRRQAHVLEAAGRLAGLVALDEAQAPEYGAVPWRYPGRALVVHRLTIAPAHQRQGLATRLMQFAERRARAKGYGAIRLDAFSQNPAATSLYEHLGYRIAGTIRLRKGLFLCFEKDTGIRRQGAGVRN